MSICDCEELVGKDDAGALKAAINWIKNTELAEAKEAEAKKAKEAEAEKVEKADDETDAIARQAKRV